MGSGLKALEPHALLAALILVFVIGFLHLMAVKTLLKSIRIMEPFDKPSLEPVEFPVPYKCGSEDARRANRIHAEFAEEPIPERLYRVSLTTSLACFDQSKLRLPLLLCTIEGPLIPLAGAGNKPRNDLSRDAAKDGKSANNQGGDVFWTHF